MKKYNFFKTDGKMPSQEQLLYTQLFYRNAPEIYAHFDEWKDNDRFYFIPLYLQMTYSCGWVAEVAPDPVWLGSFVRCTLEHPDLFQYQCPSCGKTVLPYRYAGSPLSGRIILGYSEFRGAWLGAKQTLGALIAALREAILPRSARENARQGIRNHFLALREFRVAGIRTGEGTRTLTPFGTRS